MRRGGLKTHRNEVKRQGITSATSSEVRDALKDPEILLLLTVLEKLSHVRKGVCDKRAPRSTVCEEESESNWIPAHVQVAPPPKATSRRRPSVGSISPSHEETHPLRRRNTRTSTTPGSAARGGHTEALAARRKTARPRVSSNEATGSRRDPHPAASWAPGARPAQDPSTGPQHRAPAHRTLLPRWSSDPVPRTGRPTREDGPFPSAQADLPCPHGLRRDDPR